MFISIRGSSKPYEPPLAKGRKREVKVSRDLSIVCMQQELAIGRLKHNKILHSLLSLSFVLPFSKPHPLLLYSVHSYI